MTTNDYITVIGGANVDITATLQRPLVHGDSIPGRVMPGYGGVALNIAHDLRLLGNEVKLLTAFGDDIFGDLCRRHCDTAGLDTTLCSTVEGAANGMYLCVNEPGGDMIVAVADTAVIDTLTPAVLKHRLDTLNGSTVVVADTNISTEALRFLIDNVTVPLLVDGVSATKAQRVTDALRHSDTGKLHTLKVNRLEALTIAGAATVDDAAASLRQLGVENVIITLGKDGAYYSNALGSDTLAAAPATVVNTTGAGDAFLAAVAHATCRNRSPHEAVRLGLRAAALTLASTQAVNPLLSSIAGE